MQTFIDSGAARSRFSAAEIVYQPGVRQPPHAHGYTSLTLVISGDIEERAGPTVEMAQALSVVVKPAGTVHSDRIGPWGARTFQVRLDDALAAEMLDGEASIEEWRWLHASLPARRMLAMRGQLRENADDPASVENALLDFVAALQEETSSAVDPPGWLRHVADRVDDEYTLGVSVRELAREAGVHPVFLARAFRRQYGTSVTQRVRRRRVRHAARLLSDSAVPLSSIAFEAGFSDQSHMTRVFGAATGLTPGRFRNLATE